MKKIAILLLILISYTGFAQKYVLTDKTEDKNFLANFILEQVEEGNITSNPVIILNEKVLTSAEIENFPFSKDEILSLAILNKDSEKLIETYGNNAKNGVVLIEIKLTKNQSGISLAKSNVLFLVDGKRMSEEDLKILDPNLIENIQVLKDKTLMAEYSAASYDGVVIINLKK